MCSTLRNDRWKTKKSISIQISVCNEFRRRNKHVSRASHAGLKDLVGFFFTREVYTLTLSSRTCSSIVSCRASQASKRRRVRFALTDFPRFSSKPRERSVCKPSTTCGARDEFENKHEKEKKNLRLKSLRVFSQLARRAGNGHFSHAVRFLTDSTNFSQFFFFSLCVADNVGPLAMGKSARRSIKSDDPSSPSPAAAAIASSSSPFTVPSFTAAATTTTSDDRLRSTVGAFGVGRPQKWVVW